jgi:1-acyl-sn-glycerol-3-phosphate acyltransferase
MTGDPGPEAPRVPTTATPPDPAGAAAPAVGPGEGDITVAAAGPADGSGGRDVTVGDAGAAEAQASPDTTVVDPGPMTAQRRTDGAAVAGGSTEGSNASTATYGGAGSAEGPSRADVSVVEPVERPGASAADPTRERRRGRSERAAKHPERGYRIAAAVVKPVIRTWFRLRLEGHEHLPEAGPVILASNHRSNMDPVVLASAVKRPVAFMAKAELFVAPLGWILHWIGQFPVRRGGIDREALRQTDAILARGSVLGLFPEGTRGDGTFATIHPGLAYILVRQRCPVLPVMIFGTERVRRRFGWLPFASPVRIVIGPAIDLPQSTGDRAGRRAASGLLQRRLQEFLAVAAGPPDPQSTNSQSDE